MRSMQVQPRIFADDLLIVALDPEDVSAVPGRPVAEGASSIDLNRLGRSVVGEVLDRVIHIRGVLAPLTSICRRLLQT